MEGIQVQPYSNPLTQGTFLDNKYFDPSYLFNNGYAFFYRIYIFLFSIRGDLKNIYFVSLFILATFFIFIIFYCIIRLFEIREKEHHHVEHEIAEYAHHMAEREQHAQTAGSTNPRWVQTLEYLYSGNPGDWKLAIIEADSMLDTLMDDLGFHGATLGEKLRMANQENFRNLTSAWEVHNIRNRIAHEGMNYELSQHEAKRVIATYENIFRGFGYI